MTKREKAQALAVRHEMMEKGVTFSQIMRFATTAEVHGYWKGVFCPTGRPANLYALAAKILGRKEIGAPMNRRPRKGVYAFPARRQRPVPALASTNGPGGCQLALAF